MLNLDEDYYFSCPYCDADVWVRVDVSGGKIQAFTQDCEVCCQPVAIRLKLGEKGVEYFNSEQEA